MTPAIRRANYEDLEPIVALWDEMMAEHQRGDPRIKLAEGALAAYRTYAGYHLTHSDSCVRVAEVPGGVIAGFCLAAINRNLPMFEPQRYGYLSDLAVTPAWQGKGIGRALVQDLRDWLRRRGVDTIQLQYYTFNEGGATFWRAMGFKPFYMRMWRDL